MAQLRASRILQYTMSYVYIYTCTVNGKKGSEGVSEYAAKLNYNFLFTCNRFLLSIETRKIASACLGLRASGATLKRRDCVHKERNNAARGTRNLLIL